MSEDLFDLMNRNLTPEELKRLPKPKFDGSYEVLGTIEIKFIRYGTEAAAGFFLGYDHDLRMALSASKNLDGSLVSYRQDLAIEPNRNIIILRLDLFKKEYL